jgi:hypothetical protein
MPKIPINLDPTVLAKLRATANREGITIDEAANRLRGNALRTPLSTGSLHPGPQARPIAQSYDYDDTPESPESPDTPDEPDTED